jgi:hypothetical protein
MPEALDIRWFLFCRWLAVRRERLVLALVWRLPRWLVYWSAIRLMAHATTGRYSSQVVPDLTAMDALKRWDTT